VNHCHRPLFLALPSLALVALVVPIVACVVNNNQSPGAQGTIAPTVTVDPNVAVAMPGASAQATGTVSASAYYGPYGPPPRR
jgi:hypothetical protein